MRNLRTLTDEELATLTEWEDPWETAIVLQERLRRRVECDAGDASIAWSLRWVAEEQGAYAKARGGKYADAREEERRLRDLDRAASRLGGAGALAADHGWWVRLTNYASRAFTLGGPTTPNGLQALGKLASTAVALHATALRIAAEEGVEVPAPGRPSGELARWDG